MSKFFRLIIFVCWCFTLFGAENKIYKIGTDTNFPPFEFRNEDGKLIGVDIDLLEAIAEDQKFEYKIYELGFKQSLNALETGKLDAVMASVNITEERKLKYDFSDPYFKTGTALAVEKNTNLNSYDGLKGKFITVKRNTLSSKVAEDLAKKYKFYIMYLDSSLSLAQDVAFKMSYACFDDSAFLKYHIKEGVNIKIVVEDEEHIDCGLAVKKGENEELLKKINKGLENLKKNGKYEEIINKYID